MHNRAITPSEVRHRVDRDRGYPLVRLTGVLYVGTSGPIRSALFEVLAGQPEAIVVDVGALEVRDAPAAVGMLRGVFDGTRTWPGSHLVLCGPTDAGPWRETGWSVWPDCDRAFAALGTPDPGHRVALDLEPVVGSARRCRELITEACGLWEQPGLAGSACIVATEMVNNVVAHAKTPMRVLLALRGDTMSVAVRDDSTVAPHFDGRVDTTTYGGRGMLLIDSMAARWGHLPLAGGKVVWAVLQPEPAR